MQVKKVGVLSALLGASLLTGSVMGDQPVPAFDAYRIRTDDCGGCSPAVFDSAAAVSDYLAASASARGNAIAAANGNGGVDGKPGRGLNIGQKNRDIQIVYLDFDAQEPTFSIGGLPGAVYDSYFYTPEDRDAIQARMEADYAAFSFEFTQSKPTSGDFTTIEFGCGQRLVFSLQAVASAFCLDVRITSITTMRTAMTMRSSTQAFGPSWPT